MLLLIAYKMGDRIVIQDERTATVYCKLGLIMERYLRKKAGLRI